jgi:hypothetical protein
MSVLPKNNSPEPSRKNKGWLASLVVSLVAPMPWNVPCAYLSSASTADNYTNSPSLTTQRMPWIS